MTSFKNTKLICNQESVCIHVEAEKSFLQVPVEQRLQCSPQEGADGKQSILTVPPVLADELLCGDQQDGILDEECVFAEACF